MVSVNGRPRLTFASPDTLLRFHTMRFSQRAPEQKNQIRLMMYCTNQLGGNPPIFHSSKPDEMWKNVVMDPVPQAIAAYFDEKLSLYGKYLPNKIGIVPLKWCRRCFMQFFSM